MKCISYDLYNIDHFWIDFIRLRAIDYYDERTKF